MSIKRVSLMVCLFIVFNVFAQKGEITGNWRTIDDSTGDTESVVEIFKKSDGKYYGRVIKMLVKPDNDNCVKCRDDRKDQPLIGLEIIRGLLKDGDEFTGGSITDPKNGKSYKCTITRDNEKLNVRGYIGFSLIGRTQVWHLAK